MVRKTECTFRRIVTAKIRIINGACQDLASKGSVEYVMYLLRAYEIKGRRPDADSRQFSCVEGQFNEGQTVLI